MVHTDYVLKIQTLHRFSPSPLLRLPVFSKNWHNLLLTLFVWRNCIYLQRSFFLIFDFFLHTSPVPSFAPGCACLQCFWVFQCFYPFSFSNVSTTIDPIWDISLDLGPGPGSSAAAASATASGAAVSAVGDPVLPGAAGSAVADLSSTANLSPASGKHIRRCMLAAGSGRWPLLRQSGLAVWCMQMMVWRTGLCGNSSFPHPHDPQTSTQGVACLPSAHRQVAFLAAAWSGSGVCRWWFEELDCRFFIPPPPRTHTHTHKVLHACRPLTGRWEWCMQMMVWRTRLHRGSLLTPPPPPPTHTHKRYCMLAAHSQTGGNSACRWGFEELDFTEVLY